MAIPHRTTTTTLEFQAATVADLQEALDGLPPTSRVSFTHVPGDQRDPSYTRMTITH